MTISFSSNENKNIYWMKSIDRLIEDEKKYIIQHHKSICYANWLNNDTIGD